MILKFAISDSFQQDTSNDDGQEKGSRRLDGEGAVARLVGSLAGANMLRSLAGSLVAAVVFILVDVRSALTNDAYFSIDSLNGLAAVGLVFATTLNERIVDLERIGALLVRVRVTYEALDLALAVHDVAQSEHVDEQ